jgi:hypothetical protein
VVPRTTSTSPRRPANVPGVGRSRTNSSSTRSFLGHSVDLLSGAPLGRKRYGWCQDAPPWVAWRR